MVWLVGGFPDIEVEFSDACPRYLDRHQKWLLHPPSGGSGVASQPRLFFASDTRVAWARRVFEHIKSIISASGLLVTVGAVL